MSNELRVRQNFLSGVVDDNPLGSGATTLTSSALASLVAIGSTQHVPIILDPGASAGAPEVVYVTAHTASATTATILRGQEGTSARSHAQNIPWVHGPTARDFPRARSANRSSSDITINSATWVDVDTSLDVTIPAQAGDVLDVDLYARASSTTGAYLVLDFHTLVSGTPTTSIVTGSAPGSSPASSSAAWARGNVPNAPTYSYLAGSHLYTVQSGDLSSGAVTLRLRAVSGGSVTLFASDPALKLSVKNIGSGA